MEHTWHETAEWESLRRGGGRLQRRENACRTGDGAGDFGLEYCSGSISGELVVSSEDGPRMTAERCEWGLTLEIEVIVIVERRRRDAMVQCALRSSERTSCKLLQPVHVADVLRRPDLQQVVRCGMSSRDLAAFDACRETSLVVAKVERVRVVTVRRKAVEADYTCSANLVLAPCACRSTENHWVDITSGKVVITHGCVGTSLSSLSRIWR